MEKVPGEALSLRTNETLKKVQAIRSPDKPVRDSGQVSVHITFHILH